jgi:hypothetical protein
MDRINLLALFLHRMLLNGVNKQLRCVADHADFQNEAGIGFSRTQAEGESYLPETHFGEEVKMGHWVRAHRPVSDVKIMISFLILGFVVVAMLLISQLY